MISLQSDATPGWVLEDGALIVVNDVERVAVGMTAVTDTKEPVVPSADVIEPLIKGIDSVAMPPVEVEIT